jgi:hypothetical protein
MSRKYQVISGDGHLEIPPDPWIRHVPDEHRDARTAAHPAA